MEAEQLTIEYTIKYKRQLLEQEILDVKLWSGTDLSTLKDLQPEWFPTFLGKLFQVLVILLFWVLSIVPLTILNCSGVYERWQLKRMLKTDLRYLESLSAPYQSPDGKNIEELWLCYGLDKRYEREERVHMIEKWVELLYGSDVLKRLDLNARLTEIRRRNFDANTPYYSGDSDAPHFCFMENAESLIREIAKELPAYDEV